MTVHECLPQTMTKENLADFIRSNKIDTHNHVEKIPLTDEEKQKLAMESSLASRAITKLENLKKYFEAFIKKGTPWDHNAGEDGDHRPLTVTIPPTKGLEKLKANRLFADGQLDQGYKEDVTTLYFIPWPEYEKMVAVTIEGYEWSKYSRAMKPDEVRQHGKPILKASEEVKDIMEAQGLEIEKVDGKEVRLRKRNDNAIDKQPELTEAELEELNKKDEEGDGEENLNL